MTILKNMRIGGETIKLIFFFIASFFLFSLFAPIFTETLSVVESAGFDITSDPCEGKDSCLSYLDNEKLPDAIQIEEGETLSDRVVKFINQVLLYIGLILTLIVIYAGVVILFSFSDDDGIESAKKIIINAMIGIVIIILSYSIVYAIGFIMKKDPMENSGTTGTIGGNGTTGTIGGSGTGGTIGGSGTGGTIGGNGTTGTIGGNGTIGTIGGNGTGGTIGGSGTGGTIGGNGTTGTIGGNGTIGTIGGNGTIGTIGGNGVTGTILGRGTDGTTVKIGEGGTVVGVNKDGTIEWTGVEGTNSDGGKNGTIVGYGRDGTVVWTGKSGVNSEMGNNGTIDGQINDLEKGIDDVNVAKIQKGIDVLKKNYGNNEKLFAEYENMQGLVNTLEQDPKKVETQEKIKTSIGKIKKIRNSLQEIKPSIFLKSSRASAPTIVTLSAEKTVSPIILSNDNYHWSVVGPDGKSQIVGNGITRAFTITVPGRYVFSLYVDSPNKNVLSGISRKAVTVIAPDTEALFSVGGKTMNETIEFTQEQNREGIIFNPSETKPKNGRVITRYIWNFNGVKKEENLGRSVLYSFPKEGTYFVSLEVEDNIGERVLSKKVNIEIKKIVSYFKLDKNEYDIGETVKFSGEKSVSSNGFIQEYDWKVLKSDGEIVAEYQSQNFEYSFDSPSQYLVKLVVKDAEGHISSSSQSFIVVAENPKPKFTVKNTDKGNPGQRFFDAIKSTDPSGSNLKYSWDFDGDGVFEKTDLNTPTIEYIFPEAKEYVVVLRVENKFGKFEIVKKKVDILSVLSAKINIQSLVYPVNTDVELNVLSNTGNVFEWSFGDGSKKITTSESSVVHTYTKSGKYIITLVVSDENENTITVKKTIFIGLVDKPTAAILLFVDGKLVEQEKDLCGSGKDGIEIFRSQNIEFSAEKSVNKNGKSSSLSYYWEFSSGEKESTSILPWKFEKVSAEGECAQVSLFVKDKRSNKKSEKEFVYVYVKNTKPSILNFSAKSPKKKLSPMSSTLSIKAKDPDGKIMKYSWWVERKKDATHKKIGFHTTQEDHTTITIPDYGEEGSIHEYSFFGSVVDDNDAEVFTIDSFGKIPPVFVKTDINRKPKVTILLDKDTALLGDNFDFTALVKTVDGVDVSHLSEYKWDFNNDGVFDKITSINKVSYKYKSSGPKEVRLKVLYQGLESSKIYRLEVAKVSKLPLAKFLVQKTGVKPEEVLFNATDSIYDKSIEGNGIEYIWDIDLEKDSDGDGNPKNDKDYQTAVFTHVYPHGQLQSEVSLIIKDAQNSKDTIIRKININNLSGVIMANSDDVAFSTLISESSSKNIQSVQENLDNILKQDRDISDEELNSLSDAIELLNIEIKESDYLYADVNTMNSLLSDLRKNPKDKKTLLDLNNSFDTVMNAYRNYSRSKWKPIGELGGDINSSLIIDSTSPFSQLNLYGGESFIKENEKIEIFAFIQNVDGSLYSGTVKIKLLKGNGIFALSSVESVNGRAIFSFTPTDLGDAIVEVEAIDTLSGSLTEQLQFIIQE